MAERPPREQIAAVGRVSGADVPAQSTESAGNRYWSCHQFESLRLQHAYTLELSAVQQHLRKACEIIDRRKQSGVSGDSAESVRTRVVHLTGQLEHLGVAELYTVPDVTERNVVVIRLPGGGYGLHIDGDQQDDADTATDAARRAYGLPPSSTDTTTQDPTS